MNTEKDSTQQEAVQGYVPALRTKNHKRVYLTIYGKRTDDYMSAACLPTVEEAMGFARSCATGIYELPGCNPIDGNCNLLPKYEYGA